MDAGGTKGEPIILGRKAYYWGRKTKFCQGPGVGAGVSHRTVSQ